MTRIAVFDSGLGSLSIIQAIQKKLKCEIIYLADQQSFPYGNKSKCKLEYIIKKSINFLKENYSPEIIVLGSNTPSVILDSLPKAIIKIKPPLIIASKITKTNNIALLATKSTIKSKELSNYIKTHNLKKNKIHKINTSSLVNLVESGKFISDKKLCRKTIRKLLGSYFNENKIDVATLSSTHLPFLKSLLQNEFPDVIFIEPSDIVVDKIIKKKNFRPQKRNSIKILTTGNPKKLKKIINALGIKTTITQVSF